MPNLIVSPNVDTLLSAADNAAIRTNIELGTTSSPTFANLALTSPSLASSAPVTISQTWNAGSNVMTALKVVATDTASGGASNLLELWAGSTPALNFRVSKNGVAHFGSGASRPVLFDANGGLGVNRADVSLSTALIYLGNNGTASRITIVSGGTIGWGSSSADVSGGNATPDTVLLRDGAPNTLALRNAGAPQTFNVYGTSGTNNTDYRRLGLYCPTTGEATIQSQFSTPVTVTGMGSTASTATIFFTTPAAFPTGFPVGSTVSITGITPAGYNGTYTVTASNSVSVTYANTTNAAYTGGGTAVVSGFTGTVSINGVPVGLGKGNVASNVAIGTGSLNANTTGTDNVAVGFQTLNLVSGNYENVAVGYTALKAGGFRHVAIGYGAAQAGQANDGVDIGWAASFNRTSGALNTIVGRNAARTKVNGGVGNLTNFSNCVLIGSDVKAFDNGDTNEIVIGYDATGIGSNSVVLGNDSITKTALKGNVGIGTTNPTANLQIAQPTTGVGTISVGAGLTTVTGVGTQFLNTFKVGDTITSAGQPLTISAIASDTSMTTSAAGAAISGQPYTLVGGTRMSVLGNGNVGIGTTAPGSTLTVAGTFHFGSNNGALPGGTSYGGHIGTSQDFALRGTSTVSTNYYIQNGSSGNKNAAIRLLGSAAGADHGALDLNVFESSPILFTTGLSNERMRITAAGNVGIGTTAPTANLHVSGVDVDQGTKRVALFQSNDLNIHNEFSVVGITSADPTVNTFQHKLLDLDFSAATLGSTGTYIRLLRGGTEFAGIGLASDEFVITTGATEKVRVSAAGNVGIGTPSPSSKLHVVGDAVLTGQLLGGDYTVGTVATATQANISITNNHTATVNSGIVITPKGTGAFILGPKPDGTITGGGARGAGAVDLQMSRTNAALFAEGNYSAIGGGSSNWSPGVNSVIGGGLNNSVLGLNATIGGGNSNVARDSHSTIGGGGTNTCASGGPYAFIGGGQSNTASATHSVVSGGTYNTSSESFAFVNGGRNGLANRYALNAHSAGQFSQVGDAQKTTAVFRNKTTTNSAVELFLDGALQRYTVTSGKIISMLINITGTKSDGSAVAHYVRQYSIKNIGGTTSEVYAAVTVGTDNAAGTSIALSADNTNDSLKIEVTGVASETWRWVASVDAVEVGHGV